MHETRYDWLADRWVIFAPNREDRPNEFRPESNPCATAAEPSTCPFCSGAENETPEPTLILPRVDMEASRPLIRSEFARDRNAYVADWKVRVVPNKFPAIENQPHGFGHQGDGPRGSGPNTYFCSAKHSEMSAAISDSRSLYSGGRASETGRRSIQSERESDGDVYVSTHEAIQSLATLVATEANYLFRKECVSGAHEVIIESPTHVDSITALPTDHVEMVLAAFQMRLSHWRSQTGLQYAVVFKNYGSDAGASLSHSHSQLISLDFVPSEISRVHRRLVEHNHRYGVCYICHLLNEELKARDRIVLESEHFVALCPFASRFPYGFSILPREHRTHFDEVTSSELKDLAVVLKSCLSALETAQPYAAYNFVLQTAPFQRPDFAAHHWRLRVIPRLCKVAGFEWGSDCFINTTKPEYAASVLRRYLPD